MTSRRHSKSVTKPWVTAFGSAVLKSSGSVLVYDMASEMQDPHPVQSRGYTWRPLDQKTKLGGFAQYLPLTPGRSWVAGGAVRRHVQGHGLMEGDFDIFVADAAAAQIIEVTLDAYDKATRIEDQPKELPAWTIKTHYDIERDEHVEIRAQLINFTSAYSETPIETMEKFDFTICQGAVVRNPGGGYTMVCSPCFEADVACRVLRPVAPRSLRSFVKRMQKFIQLGYYMDEATLKEWCERLGDLPSGMYEEESYG